jgi:hypothetical protein
MGHAWQPDNLNSVPFLFLQVRQQPMELDGRDDTGRDSDHDPDCTKREDYCRNCASNSIGGTV